jgi:tripartite-type tricarboxylate transporter receptor subunit TctC
MSETRRQARNRENLLALVRARLDAVAARARRHGDRMKLPRRQFLHLAAGAAALQVVSRIAWGESYPSRPVRVIVPFAPAGTTDIAARLMGQWLSERLGQQFVIENRPGASTTIGTEAVVRAPADGYTLLLVSTASAINTTLFESKLNYNFLRDIVPIAGIFRVPNVMVVHPSVPAKTVPEFIAYAKANPGKINVESPGTGTSSHLAGELFKLMTGVDMVHIQYRGNGPALIDLLAGQVQVGFDTMPASIEYIRAGKLRALAVCTVTRSHALPDVPTVAEFVPKDACRGHLQAQQGDQCWSRRSQTEGSARRPGRHYPRWLARRFQDARCRRNREVGQGDPGGQHQARVIRAGEICLSL